MSSKNDFIGATQGANSRRKSADAASGPRELAKEFRVRGRASHRSCSSSAHFTAASRSIGPRTSYAASGSSPPFDSADESERVRARRATKGTMARATAPLQPWRGKAQLSSRRLLVSRRKNAPDNAGATKTCCDGLNIYLPLDRAKFERRGQSRRRRSPPPVSVIN